MAANYKESKIYACSAQDIMTELSYPRTHSMLGVTQKSVQPWLMQYHFNKGVTLTSWGENISIKLTPMGETQTSVEVYSECALATQVIDWGKNKQNVHNIFGQLDSLLLPYINKTVTAQQAAQNAPAASPEQPAVQQPQAAAQSITPMKPGAYGLHCAGCGMPLTSAANFCSRCGKPVVRP